MVAFCAICGNLSPKNPVRLFVVPDGERKLWNKICKKELPKMAKVCEIHFKKSCFNETRNKTLLKPGSVPTLFLTSRNTKALQNATTTTGAKKSGSKDFQNKARSKPRNIAPKILPVASTELAASNKVVDVPAAEFKTKSLKDLQSKATSNVEVVPILLSSAKTVSSSILLKDAPPTTGYKNLQSKVQTVCLPPVNEATTARPPSVATIKPANPANCAALTTINPANPANCAALSTIDLTQPSAQCTPIQTIDLTTSHEAPVIPASFSRLPPSLTITPAGVKPLPPLEFVSVNTPVKPLKSDIGNTPPQPSPAAAAVVAAKKCIPITMPSRVNSSAPIKLEVQKYIIPCKITKIDASQAKPRTSLPIISQAKPKDSLPIISTNVTQTSKNNMSVQTSDEYFNSAVYLENFALKKENTRLKAELKRLKQKMEFYEHQDQAIAKLFTENQIRKLRSPGINISWTWKDICWAITLQAAGPRAYKHLFHKGFPIPCLQTLQRWIRNIKFENGVLTPVIDILKDIAELQTDDRVCVLCFDEIELCPNPNADTEEAQRQFAQVAIVRGLKSPWKQPIYFDFNCVMSKSIILDIVKYLHESGFVVAAMIAKLDNDQKLLEEFEISKDKNWFQHPCDRDAQIFIFIDAPELLNCLRNQFIDGGFIFREQLISSDNVQQILTNHLNKTRLSKVLLEIKNFGREKYRQATQVFSRTTVNSILKYRKNDSFDSNNAIECADFIKLICDWYEIFSSSPCSVATKKAFGLSLESQIDTLAETNEVMEQNVFYDTNCTSLFSFQDAIIFNNKSLCDFYDHVKAKYQIEHILTFRLNRDIMETFFDGMKGDKPHLQHLSPKEFQQGLRKYLFSKNVRHFRKNFKELANEPEDIPYSNDKMDESNEDSTDRDITEEHDAAENSENDITSSDVLTSFKCENNNKIEDSFMDSDVEDENDDDEYMEDFVMNEILFDEL